MCEETSTPTGTIIPLFSDTAPVRSIPIAHEVRKISDSRGVIIHFGKPPEFETVYPKPEELTVEWYPY
jgi:hypothetical protein